MCSPVARSSGRVDEYLFLRAPSSGAHTLSMNTFATFELCPKSLLKFRSPHTVFLKLGTTFTWHLTSRCHRSRDG